MTTAAVTPLPPPRFLAVGPLLVLAFFLCDLPDLWWRDRGNRPRVR